MTVDPTKINFYSGYPTDNIINILKGNITAAGTSTAVLGATLNTAINDTTLYVGVFSIDESADYQNLGTLNNDNSPVIGLAAVSQANGLLLYYWNSDSVSHTLSYEVALIAKSTQGFITPQLVGNDIYINSVSNNYQKIAFEPVQLISVTGGGSASTPVITTIGVSHNLGYFPTVRAFIDNGTKLTDVLFYPFGVLLGTSGITCVTSIGATNVTFTFSNPNSGAQTYNLTTRIYYDPS